jgi:hypothetical protein
MNEAAVAHKILNRRNSLSPIILVGEMQQVLGAEGYTMALERRWLEADWNTGELTITNQEFALQEMKKLSAEVKTEPVAESVKHNVYRMFSNNRTKIVTQTSEGLFESDETQIGDEVTVAEDGKPFTAVVKSKNPDGTYVLSFGSDKPRAERPYKQEEIRKNGDTQSGGSSAPAAGKAPAVQPQQHVQQNP